MIRKCGYRMGFVVFRYFSIVLTFLGFMFYSGNIKANTLNILVLHSYNSGQSWNDNINKGILETFQNEYHHNLDLRFEYMDTKHLEDESYLQIYKNFLFSKYQNIKIDLIISVDNAAFDFLSVHHNEFFKGIPVVFCGLNYCDSIPKGFTGIMEDVDFEDNLKTIFSLHPTYNKLYIINDRSITGRSLTKELTETINLNFPGVRYEFLTDYTLGELQNRLTVLNPDDVVLMLLFNFDREGNNFSYDIILDYLTPYCSVPIYSVWDFYLGKGIVGGRVTNAYQHGIKVSEIAQTILSGKSVDSIPVISGDTRYMYDYKVAKKQGIKLSRFPAGSEIINLPYDFILKNKLFYSLLGITILLLITFILVLAFQLKRIKKSLNKEKALTSAIEIKSEQLKIALEKAEQSNRLKAAFLSNISHEVRTPLNGIIGFTELLREVDKDKDQDKDKFGEYLAIIENSGIQLTNIIDNILNVSIIESQQVRIVYNWISINETIDFLMLEYNHIITSNKIVKGKISLNDGKDALYTDLTKFKKILSCLLDNANKFTKNGRIEIGYNLVDQGIEFYIKDTGIGIDPGNQTKIFEQFWKVKQQGKTLYGGNGLGLPISKAYVEMLGGSIRVESEPGKGSVFYFILPLQNDLEKKEDQNLLKKVRSKKSIVLIAEDDLSSYLLLQRFLENSAGELIHAKNGQEAIEWVKKRGDIDLILMDLNMPLVNGYKAAEVISSLRKEIPIVAQSAFISQEDREKAFKSGCVDFISKPIIKDNLLKMINQYI
ncbi:MAG: response regulator [Bacteroidales bacterium]|nr:response regulator [Bacteroidales bacterium]